MKERLVMSSTFDPTPFMFGADIKMDLTSNQSQNAFANQTPAIKPRKADKRRKLAELAAKKAAAQEESKYEQHQASAEDGFPELYQDKFN